jgi:dTDP-4-dehydrorhamnose reductase
MLGSMVSRVLVEEGHSVTSTYSSRKPTCTHAEVVPFSFSHGDSLDVLNIARYDCIVNCAGLIKQKPAEQRRYYEINSVLPKRLTDECSRRGVVLIHFSTDCIFSGKKGTPYLRTNPCDAEDDYGISKWLGEDSRQILFRTSIFGPASDASGLFEWFRNSDSVRGYTTHIWSGLTTLELSRHVADAIRENRKPGLYQLSSDPMSKHDLLKTTNRVFGWNKTIVPVETTYINRSMVSDFPVKDIETQLVELSSYCSKWNLS